MSGPFMVVSGAPGGHALPDLAYDRAWRPRRDAESAIRASLTVDPKLPFGRLRA